MKGADKKNHCEQRGAFIKEEVEEVRLLVSELLKIMTRSH